MPPQKIVEKELSYELVGVFFDVQREHGRFFRERQYGDAVERRFIEKNISYIREFPLEVEGRKSNFVDFFVEGRILIELKAKLLLTREDFSQMKRYLKVAKCELGLLVNFRDKFLKPKRVLNPDLLEKPS